MSQNVNVNLVPGNYPKEFHVSQYDVGRQLVANIVDSTGAYSIPSGATVTLVGTKPSGFGFTLSGSVGSGGVVTFSTTATVTAEYGRIPCEIRIESGNTVLGTANCMLIVEMSPHPEGTTDGDGEVIVNQITLLLEQITQQADRAGDAKDDAKASELAAEGYAVGKQNGTEVGPESPYYHNNCKWYGAQFDEALKDYAKIDGYYKDMTVGTAKQLLSDSTTTDSEPYIYRQTAGDGDREEVEEVVGGTVAWNQLQANTVSRTNADVNYAFADGVLTVNGTASANSWWLNLDSGAVNWDFFKNHVYFISLGNTNYNNHVGNDYYWYFPTAITPSTLSNNNTIRKATEDVKTYLQFMVREGQTANNVKFKPQIFDLTQMFGTIIADYIYSLEQANAGAGVAWFRKLFPKDYYPYDPGTLRSVEGVSAHETVGFNQWDEEWELGDLNTQNGQDYPATNRIRSKNYIRVLPSTAYFFKSPYNSLVCFYDEDKNFVNIGNATLTANATFTTQSNVHYMKISLSASYGTTYNHDICINLSSSRNGEYEAYVKHSYPLDSSLTLRGIPKLDASNNLYYDGDTYESDGTVTRKYGVVDLGTLNWARNATNQFYTALPTASVNNTINMIANGYIAFSHGAYSNNVDRSLTINGASGARLWCRDARYDDLSSFVSAMSGVYLVYELATPATETADGYEQYQTCDPNGTEEWTDERTVQIPVGNVTKYHANLKEKLEDLPAIPSAPSANGTYTLKATVSGGAVTYQWVNG